MKLSILPLFILLFFSLVQAQWENRKGNIPTPWGPGYAIDACDLNTAVVALATKGVWLTMDAGYNWQSLGYPITAGSPVDVAMPDHSNIWIASDNGQILFRSSGDGAWQKQYSDTSVTEFMNFIKMVDPLNGVAMGDARGDGLPAVFLRTTDGGLHWHSVNDSAFGPWSGDVWRRLDFPNPSVGYFFESGVTPQRLYRTDDGGSHWMVSSFPDSIYIQVLKFYGNRIGLAKGFWWMNPSVNGQTVVRTLDGDGSWEVFGDSGMRWGNDFEFVPGDPAKVWFTDDSKLFFSADTGRTWTQRWSRGGRDIVFLDPLHGWVLGDDTLLLYTSTGGLTSIGSVDPARAARPSLEQNYPNPFNPSTTVCYSVPRRSHVGLAVFNMLGQKVATLVDGDIEAGYHEIEFVARSLASGTYIYRLSVGSYNSSRVMALIK